MFDRIRRRREDWRDLITGLVVLFVAAYMAELAEQHRREVEFARQVEDFVRGESK